MEQSLYGTSPILSGKRVGRTWKECGLEWSGDWKRFSEYAHFQYTGGLTLAEISEGKRRATSKSGVSDLKCVAL